jgi:glycine/D-amino acid oxidase-like deaminating enzyme
VYPIVDKRKVSKGGGPSMSGPDHYQAIVIGSGQAGTPLCQALAKAGLRTALVERAHVGGTCVNEGCSPTKTMVASGRVAYLARRGTDYGVHTGNITIDLGRVRQRKRDIVTSFRNGSQSRIEKTPNLDLLFGEASFTGPRSIQVGHHFTSFETENSCAKDLICAGINDGLHEATGFVDFQRAGDVRHRHFGDAYLAILRARLLLGQSHTTELWIDENGIGNEAALDAGASLFDKIRADDTEVIIGNVRERGSALDVAKRVNSSHISFEFCVDLNKTALIRGDASGGNVERV